MTRTQIQLAVAVLLLLAAIGGCVFWYMRVDALKEEVTQLRTKRVETEAQSARIAEAKSALATLAESEARIERYFVPQGDVVPFLETVGQTGDTLGSTVEVVSVTAEPGEGDRGRLRLALRITGSFAAVMRTVGALEYGPFDSRLMTITLDGGGEGQWSASATYAIGTYKTP